MIERGLEKMTYFVTERLEPQEHFLTCPNCNGACTELYRDWNGIIAGCEECISAEDVPEDTECPICGAAAETIYRDRKEIIGCNRCVEIVYED